MPDRIRNNPNDVAGTTTSFANTEKPLRTVGQPIPSAEQGATVITVILTGLESD